MVPYFINIQNLSNKIDLQVQNHSLTKLALGSRCADLDSRTGAHVKNRTRNEAFNEIKNRINLAQCEINKFAKYDIFFIRFFCVFCFRGTKNYFEHFLLQKIGTWFDEYKELLARNLNSASDINVADNLKLRRNNIEATAINELDDFFRELRYKCIIEFGGIAGLISLVIHIFKFFLRT